MSYPSEFAKYPDNFARIFAPLFFACSSSSSTIIPEPPEMTKPSLSESYGLDATVGVELKFEDRAPIASNKHDELQCSSSLPPAITIFC